MPHHNPTISPTPFPLSISSPWGTLLLVVHIHLVPLILLCVIFRRGGKHLPAEA
jgi:putative copper export protein